MSRSSFSIRRLISPRRSQTVDERRHSDDSAVSDEDPSLFNSGSKQQKSKSWAPARRPSSAKARRPSRDDNLVRRTQSIKRASSEDVPLPQGSPHSSSSSLCSCEGHTDTASTKSRDGTLCSPRRPERPSRSLAPKRLADRRHLCIPPLQPKKDTITRDPSTEADLKAHEAGHIDVTEHPAIRGSISSPRETAEDDGPDQWSLNVQQLIRETDEAFKAVGTAIEDAKIAVSACPMSDETSYTPSSPPSNSPRLDSPLQLKKLHYSNSTPPLPPPTRFSSVSSTSSRPRRKKSKKAKRSKTRSKKGARWQLGEEVADMFSGPFFRKMEVDELLTPDRLQALRAGRESQSQPRRSSDTMRTDCTDGSETPVEPFHLQDLPSRIGAAGVSIMLPPMEMRPAARQKSTRRKKSQTATKTTTEDDSKVAEPMEIEDMKVPPPPAKNPARFAPRPQAPLLPTIPEVVVTTPDPSISPRNISHRQTSRTFAPVAEDDFVFFQSTNYTVNHPAFHHGPIRFPKSEVVRGMKIDPDDTLDWTAFQMAILGGAGDLFSDPTDFSQRSEAEEIADFVEWFEDFGFENHGLLVSSSGAVGSPASSAEYSPMSSVSTDIDLPIPVEFEHPSGFWNEGNFDSSRFLTKGCNIRRWTMEGHPKRYTRESVDSLPPSPMMDLVVMRGSDGEPEVVPMGYNLGHDLGDFLRWNIYATGVY